MEALAKVLRWSVDRWFDVWEAVSLAVSWFGHETSWWLHRGIDKVFGGPSDH